MKYLYSVILLFSTAVLMGQTQEEKPVQTTISRFFDALHAGDTLKMKTLFDAHARLLSIITKRNGQTVLQAEPLENFMQQVASKPESVTYEEKLLSTEVRIDGEMATVWAPYEFYLNGKFSHCGVNSFQLEKVSGEWKILQIMDTRRTSCK